MILIYKKKEEALQDFLKIFRKNEILLCEDLKGQILRKLLTKFILIFEMLTKGTKIFFQ